MHYRQVKRLIDIILVVALLPLLAPLFILVALVVRIGLGSPVIFCQQRVGLNEVVFNFYKFRTMLNSRDSNGNLLPDSQRASSLGNLLRKSSLDELPQLVNVLLGDMSIVGPRPLLVRYLPFYTEQERLRHTVRPGITGLAQVSGRNALTWDEKLAFDIDYVLTMSALLDMWIILRTVMVAFRGSTVSSQVSEHGQEAFDEVRKRQML